MKLSNRLFLLLFVPFAFMVSSALCQKMVTQLPVTMSVNTIRTYPLGDSMIVVTAAVETTDIIAGYWLDKNYRLTPSKIVPSKNELVLRVGSSYYGYEPIVNRKESHLYIRQFQRSAQGVKVELKGRLLSVLQRESSIQCISFIKSESILSVTEVKGNQVTRTVDFKVGTDFDQFKKVQNVLPGRHLALSGAVAKLKIYPNGDVLRLTCDVPYNEYENGREPGKTVIYTLDLSSGSVSVQILTTTSEDDFRSFLLDSLLYRISIGSQSWEVQSLNSNGAIKARQLLIKSDEMKDLPVYFRVGQKNDVSRDESLFHTLKTAKSSEPFLTASRNRQGKLFLTAGTYFNEKGAMAPAGPTPLIGLITAVVGTAAIQSMEGPGVQRYFYFVQDATGNFALSVDDPTIPRLIMDDYEIKQTTAGANFKVSNYTDFGSHTIGLFYNKTNKQLEVVEFE